MAYRAQPINRTVKLAGGFALLLVALLSLAPPIALWWRAETLGGLSKFDWTIIRFTIFQASLSAIISVGLAIPVARALARRQFFGRSLMITLLGAPFLLPIIVAVLGLLAIWGRSGLVSQLLMSGGAERLDIYGLAGILLAHVFFNLPLATRLFLQGWAGIPAEHFRLAAQLNMRPNDIIRRLEWPMLKAIMPGALLLVFLLCMTSFAVALALGGGPKATTIELAIYQALRFDFDLGKAALLGLMQFGICLTLAFLSLRMTIRAGFGIGLTARVTRWDASSRILVLQDVAILAAVALFLGTPLLAVVARGIPAIRLIPPSIWSAIMNSLIIALSAAAFSIIIALSLAMLIDALKSGRPKSAALTEVLGLLTLSASPFVLGTGLFIMIHPLTDPFALALPITALVNMAISLPLALRILLPALEENRANLGPLADSLGMSGMARFRLFIWPAIRKPVGLAAGLAAALSMGDLGIITLFAPPYVETLPLMMYRLMGAYRMEEAAAVALILLSITLTLFWAFDRGGRLAHRTR